MEAIHSISASLFNFETPDIEGLSLERNDNSKKRDGSDDGPEHVGQVDPATLTYPLSGRSPQHGKESHGSETAHGVSLRGVMRFLFASEDEPEVNLTGERWSADEPDKDALSNDPQSNSGSKKPGTARAEKRCRCV